MTKGATKRYTYALKRNADGKLVTTRQEKRKPGRPKGSGKGKTTFSTSICLTPERLAKLDRITDNRSAWVSKAIDRAKG